MPARAGEIHVCSAQGTLLPFAHAATGHDPTILTGSNGLESFCSSQGFLVRDNDRHSFFVIFTQLPALRDTRLPGFRKEQPLHAGNELDLPGGAARHNLGVLKH